MYLAVFSRFLAQGIQNAQEAIEAVLDTAQFTKLPDSVQEIAYQKIYIHLVKNKAPPDLVRDVSEWAKKGTLRRDEVRTSQLLDRLRAGIRSIDEKAVVSNREVDEPVGRTGVSTSAKEDPKERDRPPSIPEINLPVLWTKMDQPSVRIGLIRRATQRQENLESLIRSEKRHAAFLAEVLEEWMTSGSPKDVICCRSLLSGVQQIQENQEGLRTSFWEELDRRTAIRSQLRTALEKDEEGILSQARRDVLIEIVCGLLEYLTQPLSEIPTPPPPGRQALLPEAAKTQSSWDKGRSLAESFLERARYPLSISSKKLNSVVMEAMQDDLNLLGEILRSVASEAAASNRDWPFIRSFWMTLDGALEKNGQQGMLRPLVDLMAAHEKARGTHFQSRARRA